MEPQFLLLVVFAGLFGVTVGSFLNVCIYRLPRPGLRVGRPVRSFCPTCGEQIEGRDNIPLFSWLALGGRCRSCRTPISVRYFVVESITAALFVIVAFQFVPGVLEGTMPMAAWALYSVAVAGLVVATFVDIDLRQIPDEISIGGMVIVPIAMLAFPQLHARIADGTLSAWLGSSHGAIQNAGSFWPDAVRTGAGFWAIVVGFAAVCGVLGALVYRRYRARYLSELPNRPKDLVLSGVLSASTAGWLVAVTADPQVLFTPRGYSLAATLFGMLVGSSLVFGVGVIGSKVFRKPAMGFGDVKLMGFLGGLVGFKAVVIGFFLACLLGSVYGIGRLAVMKDRYLPFGPFLAAGCLFVTLFPEPVDSVIRWYLGLF
ncbi:MAG: prepilin peptidase [Planctomycetota bacterium]